MPGADEAADCLECATGYANVDSGSSLCVADTDDDCVDSPCGNGGSCSDVGLGFTCFCDSGFTIDEDGFEHDLFVSGGCNHLESFRGIWDSSTELHGAASWTRPDTAGQKFMNFRFDVQGNLNGDLEITALYDHNHIPIGCFLVGEYDTTDGKVMIFKVLGDASDLRSFDWVSDQATSGLVWSVDGTRDADHLVSATISSEGPCTLSNNGMCVGRIAHGVAHGTEHGYGHNEFCDIKVSGQTTISTPFFDTESGYDYLRVSDESTMESVQEYDGMQGPRSLAVSAAAVISWSSDGSVAKTGWMLCTEPVETENWVTLPARGEDYADGSAAGHVVTSGSDMNFVYHVPDQYLPRREPALSESRWIIDADTTHVLYPRDASEPTEYDFDAYVVDTSATSELLPSNGPTRMSWGHRCNPQSDTWSFGSFAMAHIGRSCVTDMLDDCANEPCGPGGTCADEGILSYSCVCETGYVLNAEGTTCVPDLTDDCAGVSCGASGECVDVGLFDWTCDCPDSSLGVRGQSVCFVDCCEDCSVGPGGVGGSCVVTYEPAGLGEEDVVIYDVTCGPGYAGGGRSEVCYPDRDDDCDSEPCGVGGYCTDEGVLAHSCECDDGYVVNDAGVCEVDLTDDCRGDVNFLCGFAGTCTDEGYRAFSCTCDEGYNLSGPGYFERCLIDWEDDCVGDPCGAGGTCRDQGVLQYSCTCDDGFMYPGTPPAGSKFLTEANPADTECVITDEKIVMDALSENCQPELVACQRDRTCSTELASLLYPLDSLVANPGGNGVVTVNMDGTEGARLVMLMLCAMRAWDDDVFEGPAPPPPGRGDPSALIVPSDACEQLPCRNRGTCSTAASGSVRAFTCACAGGFTGSRCDENIDDCFVGACSNGGTCVDRVQSYECECLNGWAGSNCQDRTRTVAISAEITAGAPMIEAFSAQLVAGLATTLNIAQTEVEVDDVSFMPAIRLSWTGAIEDTAGFRERMSVGLAAAFGSDDPSVFGLELQDGDRRRLAEQASDRITAAPPAPPAPPQPPPPPLPHQQHGASVRGSRTGSVRKKIPAGVLAAKQRLERAKAKTERLDAPARSLADIASRSDHPWNTYAEHATAEAEQVEVVRRRRLQESSRMSLLITTSEAFDSSAMGDVLSAASDTESLFALVDPSGNAIQSTESSLSVSVSAEAAVTRLASGDPSSDGEAFDAVLATALADTAALAVAVGVSSDSLQPSVVSLSVCTRGREIVGSDRMAGNPCARLAFGEECEYLLRSTLVQQPVRFKLGGSPHSERSFER